MIEDPVVWYPDPILRKKAREITPAEIKSGALIQGDSVSLAELSSRMLALAKQTGGIGLAAPQVALSVRMFVISPPEELDPKWPAIPELVAINPVISDKSNEETDDIEGCLSIPRVWHKVKRAKSIKLTYLGVDGVQKELLADGLVARVIQHEFDHLEGTLMIDRISSSARFLLRKKLDALERTYEMRQSRKPKKPWSS